MTNEEMKQYAHLQAKIKRHQENCVTCVYNNEPDPCCMASNQEVSQWIREEGKYSDLNLACPCWYDEW